MHNIVISDTSTLILFTKIKKIELLNAVYGTVFTTTVLQPNLENLCLVG